MTKKLTHTVTILIITCRHHFRMQTISGIVCIRLKARHLSITRRYEYIYIYIVKTDNWFEASEVRRSSQLQMFKRNTNLEFGNKMPTRCNRGFYCRPCCLLNMFRAPLCPSSGTLEYYTVVAVVFKLLVWCGAEGYVSGFQDAGLPATTV